MGSLHATGERTVPGAPREEYWFARHDAAYRWIAAHFVTPKPGLTVVDAGAGEGWGPHLLRDAGAGVVLGLEYDAAACQHASSHYPEVSVIHANLAALPVRAASVDLFISLQVIEHLWSLPKFIRDCARTLSPQGRIVFTTPNRPVFSPGLARGERPINPFHVEEFDRDQLHKLLIDSGFHDVNVGGLIHGPRLREWEAKHGRISQHLLESVGAEVTFAPLESLLPSITAADFDFMFTETKAHGAPWEDLIAIAAVTPKL